MVGPFLEVTLAEATNITITEARELMRRINKFVIIMALDSTERAGQLSRARLRDAVGLEDSAEGTIVAGVADGAAGRAGGLHANPRAQE